MRKYKLNKHSLSIGLHNINNRNILNHNTTTNSILNKNNTLHKGEVENLEVDDNNMEEGLVEEEANSYAIIVGSHDIFLRLSKSYEKLYIL